MATASVQPGEDDRFENALGFFDDIGTLHVWNAIRTGVFRRRLKIWAISWLEAQLELDPPDSLLEELIIPYQTEGKTLQDAIFAAAEDAAREWQERWAA